MEMAEVCPSLLAHPCTSSLRRRMRRHRAAFLKGAQCVRNGAPGLDTEWGDRVHNNQFQSCDLEQFQDAPSEETASVSSNQFQSSDLEQFQDAHSEETTSVSRRLDDQFQSSDLGQLVEIGSLVPHAAFVSRLQSSDLEQPQEIGSPVPHAASVSRRADDQFQSCNLELFHGAPSEEIGSLVPRAAFVSRRLDDQFQGALSEEIGSLVPHAAFVSRRQDGSIRCSDLKQLQDTHSEEIRSLVPHAASVSRRFDDQFQSSDLELDSLVPHAALASRRLVDQFQSSDLELESLVPHAALASRRLDDQFQSSDLEQIQGTTSEDICSMVPSSCQDENPLDIMYEIVAVLAGGTAKSWVPLELVQRKVEERGLHLDLAEAAIANWCSLDIMQVDEQLANVCFPVPPLLHQLREGIPNNSDKFPVYTIDSS